MTLFDTHAHLDQEEFDVGRGETIERARRVGVDEMIAVGTTAASSRKCVEIAAAHTGVYAAVGLQPNYVAECGAEDWAEIERLVNQPKVVAVGETGLDRHWDFTPFDLQQDYFDRHMALAGARDLPFIVHMRDCDADIIEALQAEHRRRGPLRGVMHSFTGDAALAAECMALGLHVSFAGMATYKKSQMLRDCAATIPDDRLLIETDSPYLSPEPVRGKRPNEPAHLIHTAACLAAVRGVSAAELSRLTTHNARELFRISS